MRLADFIRDHMESILVEWEAFAATRTPAATDMTPLELRDHAEEILNAIAEDILTPQSAREQQQKSWGRARIIADAPETAAQSHAVLRGKSGFDINQLVAEYRALRASVLKLWDRANDGKPRNLDDVIRFDEAVDQALAESVTFYSAEVERYRNLLLGMVGHDMRGPLNTIQLGASYLAQLDAGEKVTEISRRITDSGSRVGALLDDLVDFNRTRLGLAIRVTRVPLDLSRVFVKELELLRFANPDNRIEFEVEGDVSGSWDERRLRQVLSNLVQNAVKYGTEGAPIRVRLTGGEDSVNFEVRNEGSLRSGVSVERLFDPLRRGMEASDQHDADSLGLGLYITREIARAHGGQIDVYAHPAATVFVVTLPRDTQAKAAALV